MFPLCFHKHFRFIQKPKRYQDLIRMFKLSQLPGAAPARRTFSIGQVERTMGVPAGAVYIDYKFIFTVTDQICHLHFVRSPANRDQFRTVDGYCKCTSLPAIDFDECAFAFFCPDWNPCSCWVNSVWKRIRTL